MYRKNELGMVVNSLAALASTTSTRKYVVLTLDFCNDYRLALTYH